MNTIFLFKNKGPQAMSARKTCWSEIKHVVEKANPQFYTLIEEIKPGDNLPLYLAEYSYGQFFSDNKNYYFPDKNGISTESHGGRNPLTMVLKNTLELYCETTSNVFSWMIFTPGDLLPITYWTDIVSPYLVNPGSVFLSTAGSRNAFLLNLHSHNEAYRKLGKRYAIPDDINPENAFDHYKIFKLIAEKEKSPWRTEILCFSEKWFSNIINKKSWAPLKMYFYEEAAALTACLRNAPFLNFAMHDIRNIRNLKHKEYSEEIIKQILFAALGAMPAFVPAHNEEALPLDLLANTFNHEYSIQNTPIIFHAQKKINVEDTVYLSISQNNAITCDLKTFRPLMYLIEIKDHIQEYLHGFRTHILTKNTVYGEMQKRLSLDYFSEKGNAQRNILKAVHLSSDSRIKKICREYTAKPAQTFPERAPFFKAFVGINFK